MKIKKDNLLSQEHLSLVQQSQWNSNAKSKFAPRPMRRHAQQQKKMDNQVLVQHERIMTQAANDDL